MANMMGVKVTIKGTRPFLFHKFGVEALTADSGGRKAKEGSAGNSPSEWKNTYNATKDGQLYVDPTYIFSCLRDAAKYTKSGRGSIQSTVAATLQVVNDRILFDRHVPDESLLTHNATDEAVYIDVRGVKNPATKGRNVRYRLALCPGWTTSFEVQWDPTLLSIHQIRSVVEDAGKLSGLGDGRSIGYGRFEVVEFEVVESA